jgi:zinc protease
MRYPSRLLAVSCLALCSPIVFAAPEEFEKQREIGQIQEYRLKSNGLTVLLLENHTAPVVTFMVTYLVGSRNEVTGTTGATHLLEHLMFKGTEEHQKSKGTGFDQVLTRIGAQNNATTSLDRTNYFEVFGSQHLERIVELEADRMRNLLLREQDRRPEMTVVRNEYEQGENTPTLALQKQIMAAAFQAHPYHHPTIGWRSDIEQVSIEKLRSFYDTYYWPNNATVTVIGDFQTAEALRLIGTYYGKIPRSPAPIPAVYTAEPRQEGQRRLELQRAGQLGLVGIGFKACEGLNADSYPLLVLESILTFGKTSRLYRALTDQSLTINVSSWYNPTRDPGLFTLFGVLASDVSHDTVEREIWGEIERVKEHGVTGEEVKAAVARIKAQAAFDRDGSFAVAAQLNEAIAIGDWAFYATFPERIAQVTPEQVQAAARKYLNPEQSTVGYFRPTKVEAGAAGLDDLPDRAKPSPTPARRDSDFAVGRLAQAPVASRPRGTATLQRYLESSDVHAPAGAASPATNQPFAQRVIRKRAAGIDLLILPTDVKEVVSFHGSFSAGSALDPSDKPGTAELVAGMVDKGTIKRDKFAIASVLESIGAELRFSANQQSLTVSGKCLRSDVEQFVGLLAEQLRYPAFSDEELTKYKRALSGAYRRALENPTSVARNALNGLIFPPGHPNYRLPLQEMVQRLQQPTGDDLRAFHDKYYGAASFTLVAVGDIDPDKLVQAVTENFSGWNGGLDYRRNEPAAIAPPAQKELKIRMEDKPSVSYFAGFRTALKQTSPDYLAMYVGNQIFGGATFAARLLGNIRDSKGLTYGIYSALREDEFVDGSWSIIGTFAPRLLEKGVAAANEELSRWVKGGVTNEELELHRSSILGSFNVNLSTTQGLAAQLLQAVEQQRDVGYLDRFPKELESLTVDQVNEAIRKYIQPERLVTVMAGSVPE